MGLALILLGAVAIITQNSFKAVAPYENYGLYTGSTIPGVATNGDWYQEGSVPAEGYLFICDALEDENCTFDFEQDPNLDPSNPIVNTDNGVFTLTTTP